VKDQIDDLRPEADGDLDEARVRAESALTEATAKRDSYSGPEEDARPTEEGEVQDRLAEIEEALAAATDALVEAREEKREHDAETQSLRQDLRAAETRVDGIEASLETPRSSSTTPSPKNVQRLAGGTLRPSARRSKRSSTGSSTRTPVPWSSGSSST